MGRVQYKETVEYTREQVEYSRGTGHGVLLGNGWSVAGEQVYYSKEREEYSKEWVAEAQLALWLGGGIIITL